MNPKESCDFCLPAVNQLIEGMEGQPYLYQTQTSLEFLQHLYAESNCSAVCVAKFGALARIVGGSDSEA